jgi:acyl-CoA thioester hydrolase
MLWQIVLQVELMGKSQKFQVLLRVRYAECDAQHVVFNSRYGDYVDVAATEFMRVLFGGYDQLLAQGIDNQVVRLTTNWQSPARFDDVLAISVETIYIGNTSYSLGLEFREYFSQREIATAEITYVLVSPREHQKMPIPDFFRGELLAGAAGKMMNFSGVDV